MPGESRPIVLVPGMLVARDEPQRGGAVRHGAGDGDGVRGRVVAAIVGTRHVVSRPTTRGDRWLLSALGLITGGIVGNLYDRLGLPGLEWHCAARPRRRCRARRPRLDSLHARGHHRLADLQSRRLLAGDRRRALMLLSFVHGAAARRRPRSARLPWNSPMTGAASSGTCRRRRSTPRWRWPRRPRDSPRAETLRWFDDPDIAVDGRSPTTRPSRRPTVAAEAILRERTARRVPRTMRSSARRSGTAPGTSRLRVDRRPDRRHEIVHPRRAPLRDARRLPPRRPGRARRDRDTGPRRDGATRHRGGGAWHVRGAAARRAGPGVVAGDARREPALLERLHVVRRGAADAPRATRPASGWSRPAASSAPGATATATCSWPRAGPT